MAGTLVIARNSPKDIGMRDLYVLVDDLPERTLLFGETLRLELAAGDHSLKVTNRLFSKVAGFSLSDGQEVSFRVSNKGLGGLFSVLVVIGGTGAYKVTLEPISPL